MDEVMCPYNKLIYSQTHGSSIHYLSLDRAVQSPPPPGRAPPGTATRAATQSVVTLIYSPTPYLLSSSIVSRKRRPHVAPTCAGSPFPSVNPHCRFAARQVYYVHDKIIKHSRLDYQTRD